MEREKGSRLLYLYQELTQGRGIQKQEAAIRFGVTERSIQRDIEDLRNFLAVQDPPAEVRYVPAEKRYRLAEKDSAFLTRGEMIAVCKALLESRSLQKRELDAILDKLLSVCVSPGDKRAIAQVIRNEQFYYTEPRHGQPLTEWLWTLAQAVQSRSVLQVRYRTQAGEEKQRTLQPVGLMFSEFYLTDRLY